ncbi:hypothetical protein psyc5s11_29930 [Clostridium gelidum]|uniref:Uncharacterized protein n=1 Tax=Clostridium gelidum TaxID=704125 RepID=A0ABM7T6N2_9CLOT|nr:hypothetical protein [Clostridium gelidum]BCZ46926.1 hypothetical protein psyc5s11_29930 [Clostridium gelidum]
MPLHNLVPLCSFKYVGDTLSGATFNYDTLSGLTKSENKILYKTNDPIINKNNNKLLTNLFKNIAIITKNKNLEKEKSTLIKCELKMVSSYIRKINIGENKDLRVLNYNELCLASDKNLSQQNIRELNQQSLKEIALCDLRNIESQMSKELNKDNPIIYKVESHELSIEDIIQVYLSGNLNLEMQNIKEFNVANYNTLEINKRVINKQLGYSIQGMEIMGMNKTSNGKYVYKPKSIIIGLNDNSGYQLSSTGQKLSKEVITKYYYKTKNISLELNDITKLLYRIELKQLNKDSSQKDYNRMSPSPINKDASQRGFYKLLSHNISKDESKNYLDRIHLSFIFKDNSKRYFYKQGSYLVSKNKNRYFYKETLVSLLKKSESYLDRVVSFDLYKNFEKQLGRISLFHLFNSKEHYLKNMNDRIIYTQKEKGLLDLGLINLSKSYNQYLNDFDMVGIYKESNYGFIDVVNRWWWLNPSAPKDSLIVPNKDYAEMIDLLENPNFEYLRYNHHPIEWGQKWGIDYDIPPRAISVEIMLDLVNIITMIWHKNVQGWLCCTGKEGIQFLMELIYDWYSMNNSNPNSDYHRAYRWIRWEAEKVYFLKTSSGLQSIGILVTNLIAYMKNHHFNLTPLWSNVKAMDEERNFNHIAKNGDLMQELDKIKGNRHYLMETQNFERKNIFRR